MITGDQIVAHLVGDYILQSDWMGVKKTDDFKVAFIHGFFYSVPFLFLNPSLRAFGVIWLSHAIIDHLRLAKYVVWVKNFLAPRSSWPRPWKECTRTGYNPDRPDWLAFWLMFIADNTIHIIINGLSLFYL